jgi:hypothetical protein
VLSGEVVANLREIVQRADTVRTVVAEIAASSDQQSQGIAQITVAVEQVNGVTQTAAANSEESAAASEELSSQAIVMKSLVGEFELADAAPRRPVRGTPRGWPIAAPVRAAARPGNGSTASRLLVNGKQASLHRFDPEAIIPFGDDDDIRTLEDF